ncbi:hypothetical protein LTR37_009593 [Vermiconidia calcicola]|uniref:Uncharacterized protein n=1 Tax=Vermiconidia calcicola TaxID=1690605 RepID=A0ACC3N7S3_9PEZI|nr:hypothetical protein LTR37_009593 [Vermiconidia calcicola]
MESGGGGPAKRRAIAKRQAEALVPVHCQRFFRTNKHFRYFEVLSHDNKERNARIEPNRSLESIVLEELGVLENQQEGKASAYLVQVMFNEVPRENRFVNGKPVSSDEIWINSVIRAGRTDEQKTAMCRRLTEECATICGVDKSFV